MSRKENNMNKKILLIVPLIFSMIACGGKKTPSEKSSKEPDVEVVAIPTIRKAMDNDGTLVYRYNGEVKRVESVDLDEDKIKVGTGSIFEAEEIGDYEVSFELKDTKAQKWEDDTTDPKTYTWMIKKGVFADIELSIEDFGYDEITSTPIISNVPEGTSVTYQFYTDPEYPAEYVPGAEHEMDAGEYTLAATLANPKYEGLVLTKQFNVLPAEIGTLGDYRLVINDNARATNNNEFQYGSDVAINPFKVELQIKQNDVWEDVETTLEPYYNGYNVDGKFLVDYRETSGAFYLNPVNPNYKNSTIYYININTDGSHKRVLHFSADRPQEIRQQSSFRGLDQCYMTGQMSEDSLVTMGGNGAGFMVGKTFKSVQKIEVTFSEDSGRDISLQAYMSKTTDYKSDGDDISLRLYDIVPGAVTVFDFSSASFNSELNYYPLFWLWGQSGDTYKIVDVKIFYTV